MRLSAWILLGVAWSVGCNAAGNGEPGDGAQADGAVADGSTSDASGASADAASDDATATDATVPNDAGNDGDANSDDANGNDANGNDANGDAAIDAAADADAAPPACTQLDLDDLAAAPTTITNAFLPLVARGFVFEPSLDALLARGSTINEAIARLEATCNPSDVATLRSDVASLTADIDAWVAGSPLGFSSAAPTFVLAGDVVDFTAHVAGDPASVTFSLTTAPTGMTIDTATGRVQFAPSAADKGPHAIVIEATVGAAVAKQSFSLVVSERIVRATQAVSPSSATSVTINAPGSSLDGATVNVPAGAVDANDTIVLAELDPAPASSSPGRLLGAAVEVTLSSGAKRFGAPVEIVLPTPGLNSGEVGAIVEWAQGSAALGHPNDGLYALTDVSGAAPAAGTANGTVTGTGTTAAAGLDGSPVRATSGGYRFVADPSVTKAKLDQFVASVEDAHTFIVTTRGYLDPTEGGSTPITVAIRSKVKDNAWGITPNRQRIILNVAANGTMRDNVAAHELFHVVQFHTPWKKGHGVLEYIGGARWWMEATAELTGQTFAQVNGSLLSDPLPLVTGTVTTFGNFNQYNAALFFDYLVTRHQFDVKGFWESVLSSELMASDGAEKMLASRASLDVDGVPYLPFVRAYSAERTAQNFSRIGAAANAPLFPLTNMPDAEGEHTVLSGESLSFWSSRSSVVALPSGTADNMFYATLTGPQHVVAAIHDRDTGALLQKLTGTSGEVTLGPIAGKTLALHVANTGTASSFNANASLKLRMKNVPVTVPPVEVWYLYGIWQHKATPLEACQSWVSTIPGGSNPRIIANGANGTCISGAEYCCWYTHTSNPDAGNVGVIKAYDCPAGYTNVSGTCTRN